MSSLKHVFFELDKGDCENYQTRFLQEFKKNNARLEDVDIQASTAFKKLTFNDLVATHQIRVALKSASDIKKELNILIRTYEKKFCSNLRSMP